MRGWQAVGGALASGTMRRRNRLSFLLGPLAAAGCGTDTAPPASAQGPRHDASTKDSPVEPRGPCTASVPDACPAPVPSYTSDVVPIFDAKCNGCHSGADGGPWPLTNHDDVVHWRAFVIQDLAGCTMPPKTSIVRLTEAEQQTLIGWLVCGAPEN